MSEKDFRLWYKFCHGEWMTQQLAALFMKTDKWKRKKESAGRIKLRKWVEDNQVPLGAPSARTSRTAEWNRRFGAMKRR